MKYLALLFTLMFLAIAAEAQQPAAEKPVALPLGSAMIAEMKGEVTLHAADGTVLTAHNGLALPVDATIETGNGSLVLSLADGSQVLVKSRTRVQLQAPEKAQGNFLQLLLGNIVAKVQKRLGIQPSFRMGTPTAVITVRGTRFSVEVTKKNKTIVEVYEGLVEVMGFGVPGAPVLIRPGFSTEVGQLGRPENPRSFEVGGRNDAGEDGRSVHRGQAGNESERPQSNQPEREGQQGSGSERPD